MAENENVLLDEEDGIVELVDEEGNVTRFEFIDSVEYGGFTYYALIPELDDDEVADEFVVLKEQEIDGEAMLTTVDDDEEYNKIGEVFLERFANMSGYDDDDGTILQ